MLGNSKIIRMILLGSAVLLYQNCGGFESTEQALLASSSSAVSFKCTDDSQASETKSLLLSKQQLTNAIEDLFGVTTLNNVSGALSSLGEPINDSTTHARQSLVSSAEIDSFHSIAQAVAADVVGAQSRRENVFGACASMATPGPNCIDNFINNFAVKIFRRPLKPEESTFIKNLANSGGDYLTNLEAVLSYSLQSPYFLWRLELGEGGNHTPERTYLSQYEIATRLSFATIDSVPDDALLAAAKQGQLSNLAQIKAHAERLLQTPRGQEKVADMLSWWALADRAKDVSNLPAELTGSLELDGLNEAMSDELRVFVKQIVFQEQGSFRDLMTSKKSFASHAGLAEIYGHNPVTGVQPASFGGRRQGLLMRASFLTHDTFRTSIIHRGVDFQKRYLCNNIPSPNVNIMGDRDADALTHAELLETTNRESIAHQTKDPVCMGCHSVINPTGFAFENFDSFGRLRDQEMIFDSEDNNSFVRTLPIDTNTVIPMSGNNDVPVSDAYDLITSMVETGEGAACMSRNLFRYVFEKREERVDDCELQRVYEGLNNPDQPLLEAVVELIANEHIGEKVH